MAVNEGMPWQTSQLVTLADTLPISMFITDAQGLVTYANARALAVSGHPASEFAGLGWLNSVHPADRPAVASAWREAAATGEPFEAEFRFVLANGSHVWTLARAAPVRCGGKVDHWVGTAIEITDRKQAEEVLADKERWFRSTFETAAAGVAHIAPDGRFLAVNDRLCTLLQRSRVELLATTIHKITYPADILEDEDNVAKILGGEIEHYATEKRYVLPDGGTFWSSLRVGLRRDEGGQPHHLVALVEDITPHKSYFDRLDQTLTSLGAVHWELNPVTGAARNAGDAHRLLGFSPANTDEFLSAVHSEDQSALRTEGEQFLAGQDHCDVTFRFFRPDGEQRWLRCEARKLRSGDKELLTGLLRDITEEKAARDLLHEQEERLRLAFTASDTAAWDWDVASNKVVWAGGLAERLGLGEQGFGGSFDAFWALVVDEDKPMLTDALAAAISGERDYEVEFRMRRADGSIRWTTTKAIVLRDPAGKATRLVGVDADISGRKAAEEALRQQSELLSTVLETMTDLVKVVECDGTLSYINPNGRLCFGLSANDLTSVHWASLWPEEQQDLINRAVAAGADGISSRFHAADKGPNGTTRWWDVNVVPSFDAEGKVLRLVAVARDVTETKQRERDIEALAYRTEQAQFAAGAFVYEYAPHEQRVYRSPSTLSVLGYHPDEIEPTRSGWLAIIHPDDRQRFEMEFDEAARNANSYAVSYRAVRKDGVVIRVIDVGKIFRDAEGNIERFIGSVTDDTAWSKAEEALADSEARFRAITEAMPQMVWSATPEGFHDYFNSRWYDFTGAPAGSTYGEGWRELFHPEDRPNIDKLWGKSLSTGAPYEIEYRLRAKDGSYRWVLGRALPVRDRNHNIVKWMGTCTDIEDAVRTREALQEANQAKDDLLAEVNHRVKNSFQLVSAVIALQTREVQDHNARAVLREADRRIRTLAMLHADLYQGTNHGEVEIFAHLSRLFVNTINAYAEGRIAADVHSTGELLLSLDVAIPLAMIISELATNSIKYAFPDGAQGTIRLDMEQSEGNLIIKLTDDGVGLPQGFTFASGGGVGLRIIQALAHQVRANLDTITGQPGASFRIVVPVLNVAAVARS